MKKSIITLFLLLGMLTGANAQTEFLKGDMNGDNAITMTDANALVNVFVKELTPEKLSFLDNECLVGTWYKNKSTSITFYENGEVSLEDGSHYRYYKYCPALGAVNIYSISSPKVQAMLNVVSVSKDAIVLCEYGSSTDVTYYSTVPPTKVTSINLSKSVAAVAIGKTITLTATVLPEDADDSSVTWTSSNAGVAKVLGGVVTGVAAGEATITASANDGSGVSASCKVTVTDGDPSALHDYVDLGLSVKWATCNVGATVPEECGDYFAWGEASPKSRYVWATYKWMTDGCSDWTSINKYTFEDNQTSGRWYSDETFVGDNKTVIDTEDDAAYVNWGGSWRIPTCDQFAELQEKCTWTWTTQNGHNGYKVTGPSGKSIFLPATGRIQFTDPTDVEELAYYWTNTLSANFSDCAMSFMFHKDNMFLTLADRCSGLTVRPVLTE